MVILRGRLSQYRSRRLTLLTGGLPAAYREEQGPAIGVIVTTRNSGSAGAPVGFAVPVVPIAPTTPLDVASAVAAAFGDGTSVPTSCTRFPAYALTSVPLSR